MAVYSLQRRQFIPCSIEKAWEFFSNPANLPIITPEDMRFRVISKFSGDRIYAGQVIEYRLRPLPMMSVYWMTEITHVMEGGQEGGGRYFVDEQRRGPYRLWHHQHHFRAVEGGVDMTDIVHYQLPFGWLGDLVHRWMIRRRVEYIFDYRFRKVSEIFGADATGATISTSGAIRAAGAVSASGDLP